MHGTPEESKVELFRDAKIDWLGKKWYFLGFSLIFSVAGVLSMLFWHGIPRGRGLQGRYRDPGAVLRTPNEDHIRQALIQRRGQGLPSSIPSATPAAVPPMTEIISLPEAPDATHDAGEHPVEAALNCGLPRSALHDPEGDIVGPTAGTQLQHQAELATLYSLLGMLIYLWFRFELIYGVAAVVAVFHDTLITVGAFSLTNQEITLTVIAAILTLIGYSMNDTIVVFDRIRENLALSRRESLPDVVNRSINQTLTRTVISSGLTFLTVMSLFLFGGRGAARLLVRSGGRNRDRDVFLDRSGRAHAGGVSGLAQEPGKDIEPAGQACQSLKGPIHRAGFSDVCVFV